MKVKDLVGKCGLAATKIRFLEGAKFIGAYNADEIDDEWPVSSRTVNTFRVLNDELHIYLKF